MIELPESDLRCLITIFGRDGTRIGFLLLDELGAAAAYAAVAAATASPKLLSCSMGGIEEFNRLLTLSILLLVLKGLTTFYFKAMLLLSIYYLLDTT